MTLELEIHEEPSTGKLTTYHAASVMWYVVKRRFLEMQDTLMEFSQWVESTH